jgi:ribosomal protein S18 acetylase RimI-like enzyme
MSAKYKIELIDKGKHGISSFDCGVRDLNLYLQQRAGQETRKKIAAVYVIRQLRSRRVVGYYTLSSYAIELSTLPDEIVKKIPKYPLLPVTLIGRLAVDRNFQGQKIGKHLLMDALLRSENLSREIGSMAVIVDSKDETSRSFYEKYDFKQFKKNPLKLFLPMSTIKDLIK